MPKQRKFKSYTIVIHEDLQNTIRSVSESGFMGIAETITELLISGMQASEDVNGVLTDVEGRDWAEKFRQDYMPTKKNIRRDKKEKAKTDEPTKTAP